jgi:hypothetical protein
VAGGGVRRETMAIEWALVDEALEDKDAIEGWLQKNFEPFAVAKGRVYLKAQYHNEEREPLSSTKHPNAAGNEADRGS